MWMHNNVSSGEDDCVSTLLLPLDPSQNDKVHDALHGKGPHNQILSDINNDIVTRYSMATLRPKIWLNDEVINGYVACLFKRHQKHNTSSCNHFYSSHFMKLLLPKEGYKYSNVKR